MKRLMIGLMLLASTAVFAAESTEQQNEPGGRPAYDSSTDVMLGFFTPLQIPESDYDVRGVRLNLLYGTCCNFSGLDIGFVGVTKNRAKGCRVNLVNMAYEDGLGLHAGGLNYLSGDFKGLQIGLINWTDSGDAFQVGFYNGAYDVKGLQFGLINVTDKMQGIQIGLFNIISYSDLSFFPILNGWF